MVKMEKILVKMENVEKMEEILAILEKIIVTIPCGGGGVGLGGWQFRNMIVPHELTWNRVSGGPAHVQKPILIAGAWYLYLQQETAMQYELNYICSKH